MRTLAEVVDWIYSHRGAIWRRKLDRIERLSELVGVPSGGAARFIHVAGTNGKGSVTSMVEAMMREAGLKTGSCYSPYVYSVRERAMVGGELISEEDFVRGGNKLREAVQILEGEGFGKPTVFELFTALAFWYWKEERVDTAAVEVGLGGILDCTNIIDPAVSAIVSIGFDHMDVLGDTLGEIALEKAGVAKPGRPLVLGDVPAEARDVICSYAQSVGAAVDVYGEDWRIRPNVDQAKFGLVSRFGNFDLPKPRRLRGAIQTHNAAVAAMSFLHFSYGELELGEQIRVISRGLERAFLPGRFEVVRSRGRTWIFDGAHNEQAASELVRSFRQEYPGIRPGVIFGMLSSHDPATVLNQIDLLGGLVRCVPIDWSLSADPKELVALTQNGRAFDSISAALDDVAEEVVFVTGSFYLLKDVRDLLNGGQTDK
ncbi:hypothetical protein C0431_09655 [bacterium]|nr:hypothetical protein [bacterium]